MVTLLLKSRISFLKVLSTNLGFDRYWDSTSRQKLTGTCGSLDEALHWSSDLAEKVGAYTISESSRNLIMATFFLFSVSPSIFLEILGWEEDPKSICQVHGGIQFHCRASRLPTQIPNSGTKPTERAPMIFSFQTLNFGLAAMLYLHNIHSMGLSSLARWTTHGFK